MIPKELKKLGGSFVRGLVAEATPGVAKGLLLELFRKEKADVKKVSGWVEGNVSLWVMLGEEYQRVVKGLAGQAGDFDWLSYEWVIESVKKEYPAVASLFLGWTKAANYLKRQVEIMRKELSE